MNKALVKASKEVKAGTSTVRKHLDLVERAREIYLAGMKRLEADYFDRIKHATDVLTGSDATPEASSQGNASSTTPNAEAPAAAT